MPKTYTLREIAKAWDASQSYGFGESLNRSTGNAFAELKKALVTLKKAKKKT